MKRPSALRLIAPKKKIVEGEVTLPISKSMANRALILSKITRQPIDLPMENLPNDVVVLQHALASEEKIIDLEDAGTAMRFACAYFSLSGAHKILRGTARMHQRPIAPLINALRELGAIVSYLEHEGFPPIELKGFHYSGIKKVYLPGDVSSQFASALLLCAPLLPSPLEIELIGNINSLPYLLLSRSIAQQFGVKVDFTAPNKFHLFPEVESGIQPKLEGDWSSASYWLSLAVLAKKTNLLLHGLQLPSLQGDSVIADYFKKWFDLELIQEAIGVRVRKLGGSAVIHPAKKLSFSAIPDMAQTILPLFAALQQPLKFTGVETLKIKETDRIAALRKELQKIGASMEERQNGYFLDPKKKPYTKIEINTYQDHRMALGFAPLALYFGELYIEDPEVVKKSYPSFWEDLEKVGFKLSYE